MAHEVVRTTPLILDTSDSEEERELLDNLRRVILATPEIPEFADSDFGRLDVSTPSTQFDVAMSNLDSTICVEKNPIYDDEALEILQVVDFYNRNQTITEERIETPKLVLIGARSCGTSSLLENLTGLPIPISYVIGTRFPLELAYVENNEGFQMKATLILVQETRLASPQYDMDAVNRFNNRQSFMELPTPAQFKSLFREAAEILKQPVPLFADEPITALNDSLVPEEPTRSTLKIEIKGPAFRNLAIVDNPGLHRPTTTVAQLCRDIIYTLSREKSSVIVVVMEASQPVSCQEALGYLTLSDIVQKRIVGVMTKCDLVSTLDTDSFEATISRAKSNDNFLPDGWHLIKNRSSTEAKSLLSLESARHMEGALFSTRAWRPSSSGLNPARIGISALRASLSKALCAQIIPKFSYLNLRLRNMIEAKRAEINELGASLETIQDKHQYLRSIAGRLQELIRLFPEEGGDLNLISASPGPLEPGSTSLILLAILQETAPPYRFHAAAPDGNIDADRAASSFEQAVDVNPQSAYGIYTEINYRRQLSRFLPRWPTRRLAIQLYQEQTSRWNMRIDSFLSTVEEEFVVVISRFLHEAGLSELVATRLIDVIKAQYRTKMGSIRAQCSALVEQGRNNPEDFIKEEVFLRRIRDARVNRFISAIASIEEAPHGHENHGDIYGTSDDGHDPNFRTLHEFAIDSRAQLGAILADDRQIVYEIHDVVNAYYDLNLKGIVTEIYSQLLTRDFAKDMLNIFSNEFIRRLSNEELSAIFVDYESHGERRGLLEQEIRDLEMIVARSEAILDRQVPPVSHEPLWA